MASPPLIKPKSDRGPLVILGPWPEIAIVDAQSGQVIEVSQNTGASNDRANTLRFSQPGNAYQNVILVDTRSGQPLSNPLNLANRGYGNDGGFFDFRADPGGHGDLSGAGGTGATGPGFPQSGTDTDYVLPDRADFGGLFGTSVNFNPAQAPEIPEVEFRRIDPFEVAQRAADFNRGIVGENFGQARDITRENIEFAREVLPDINQFNQEERLRILNQAIPQQRNIIDTALANAQSFLEGRIPDTIEDRIFEITARNRAAERTAMAGGGVGSPFGQSLSNLLSVQQRLNLQSMGATQGSQFLAQAAQLRFAEPQRLEYNPQEVFAAAEILNRTSTLTPAQAIQTEVSQSQFESELEQQRNLSQAGITANVNRFNSQQDLAAQQFNSELDLKVQLEQLYAEQAQNNQEASIINAALNADRADERYDALLELQQQGISASQSAQDTAAITELVTTGLGALGLTNVTGGATNLSGIISNLFGGGAASEAAAITAGETGIAGGLSQGAGTFVPSGTGGGTATGTGIFANASPVGIAAGIYTGYQQLKGIQNALQGKPLTSPQKATLAPLTGGLSLVWDDMKDGFFGVFGSGKGADQQERDGIRTILEGAGMLERANNVGNNVNVVNESLKDARGNNSHLVQLADGSYFDIGNDGGDKLINTGQNIDGKESRGYYEVDFSNETSAQTVGWTNPLSLILTGGHKFVGHLTNAAQSNSNDLDIIRKNVQTFAGNSGINYNNGQQALTTAYDQGRISYNDYLAYSNGWATLWA